MPPLLEHAVITHHDKDHITGFSYLLERSDATFDTVYHNGLASYRPGHCRFPTDQRPDRAAVYVYRGPRLRKGMAFLYPAGHPHAGKLDETYLTSDIAGLRDAFDREDLQGLYQRSAEAVLSCADAGELSAFDRVNTDTPFISERAGQRGVDLSGVEFEVLWPPEYLSPYRGKDWGKCPTSASLRQIVPIDDDGGHAPIPALAGELGHVLEVPRHQRQAAHRLISPMGEPSIT